MCKFLAKLFGCSKPENPPQNSGDYNRYLLSIAINEYPNPFNNLNGCINDQNNILNLFKFENKIALKNEEATVDRVKKEIGKIIFQLRAGDTFVIHYSGHGTQILDRNNDEADMYDEALYLYDDVLIDDELGEILDKIPDNVNCLILLDSCFSGTATRHLDDSQGVKIPKFVQLEQSTFIKTIKSPFLKSAALKWTVISGCKENQTSADAYINGRYEGAFTHYLCATSKPGLTIKEWFNRLSDSNVTKYQNPTLEGVNFDHIYV